MKKAPRALLFFFSFGGFVFLSFVFLPCALDDALAGLRLLGECGALVDVARGAAVPRALGLLPRVLGNLHEAVRRGERLRLQVEHLLDAVEAECAVAGRLPLLLVGVDVDAGLRLLVAPAAREDLATRALRLALGHLLAALLGGTDALLEEAGILARARDAELHLAALRAPLVRLLLGGVGHDAVVALLVRRRLLRHASSALLGRLVGDGLLESLHDLVAPARAATDHLMAHLQHDATEQGVLRAVARAAGRRVLDVDGRVEDAVLVARPHFTVDLADIRRAH